MNNNKCLSNKLWKKSFIKKVSEEFMSENVYTELSKTCLTFTHYHLVHYVFGFVLVNYKLDYITRLSHSTLNKLCCPTTEQDVTQSNIL